MDLLPVIISSIAFNFRMSQISDAAKARRVALDDSYLLQHFLFEVSVQLSWIDEHLAQINIAETGANLTTAKRLLNRHEVIHQLRPLSYRHDIASLFVQQLPLWKYL